MLTIVGIANQVECPMTTVSGITDKVDVDRDCTNCHYVYQIRRVKRDVVTVDCKYDAGGA